MQESAEASIDPPLLLRRGEDESEGFAADYQDDRTLTPPSPL